MSTQSNASRQLVTQQQKFSLMLAALAFVGMGVVWTATPLGAGLSPDSVKYLDAARNLARGAGYAVTIRGVLQPLTDWPPLFSALLAAPALAGIDPWQAARCVNALLAGANVWLVGFLIYWLCNRSTLAGLAGGVLWLTSTDVLQIHAMVWSEPLFITLSLAGLFLLCRHLANPRWLTLIGSSALCGLASLTRYAGLSWAAAGALILVLVRRQSWKRRLLEAAVFGLVAVMPMLLFALRNRLATSGFTPPASFAFHPPPISRFTAALPKVALWLADDALPWRLFRLVQALVLLGIPVAAVISWGQLRSNSGDGEPARMALILLATCGLGYLVFFTYVICFVFWTLGFAVRYLVPLHALALIFGFGVFHRLLRKSGNRHWQTLAGLLILVLSVSGIGRTAKAWREDRREGLGYASAGWRQSETLALIRKLPAQVTVFSNEYEAVHFLTGRPSLQLPVVFNGDTGERRKDYEEQIASLRERLLLGRSVIAYFPACSFRPYVTPLERLQEDLPLLAQTRTADGVLFTLRPLAHGETLR